MRKIIVTVAEAASNLTDCVNRVHDEDVTFVLVRNGTPVARLVRDSERICVGRDLAEVLREVELSRHKAGPWHRDGKGARRNLNLPPDKWR